MSNDKHNREARVFVAMHVYALSIAILVDVCLGIVAVDFGVAALA